MIIVTRTRNFTAYTLNFYCTYTQRSLKLQHSDAFIQSFRIVWFEKNSHRLIN